VADLLDQTLAEIRARLKELRPLVAEYERLEAAAAALNGQAHVSSATRPRRRRPASSRRPRAPRGANKEKIYAAIEARPGATVGEIAEASGVAKRIIYNVTRQGVEKGELERQELPSGSAGFKRATTDTSKNALRSTAGSKPGRRRAKRAPKVSDPGADVSTPAASDDASGVSTGGDYDRAYESERSPSDSDS
jgi:hypothetical protein